MARRDKKKEELIRWARIGIQKEIDEKRASIVDLEKKLDDLRDHEVAPAPKPEPRARKRRRKMSAAARKRISDAQKARWAKLKAKKGRGGKKTKK